jgi:hypothetical protein
MGCIFEKITRKNLLFFAQFFYFLFFKNMCRRKTCNGAIVLLVFLKISVGIMVLNDNQDNKECEYNAQIGRVSLLSDVIFVIGMYFSFYRKNQSLILSSIVLFGIWIMSLLTMTEKYDPNCLTITMFSTVYALIGLVLEPTYILISTETFKEFQRQDANLRLQLAREDIV